MSQPAGELRCVRPGCAHSYVIHSPGGGSCRYWFPLSGEHCDCHGFRWVPLDSDLRPPVSRRGA